MAHCLDLWVAVYLPLPVAVKRPGPDFGSGRRRRTWCAPALLLAALLAMGLAAGCSRPQAAKPDSRAATRSSDSRPEATEPAAARNYSAVAQRNVFRPLVVAPKGEEGGGGGAGEAPRGSTAGTPQPRPSQTPPQPPGPTADLAITGLTETTDGLRVLVEKISTGEGRFAGIGDNVFGLTIKSIRARAVTLTMGDKEYELKLGEKDMPGTAVASATTKPDQASATSPAGTSPQGPPGASMMSGRTDWRSMSEEQRRAAMDSRRNWWEGLSEGDRDRYRSRGGRGGPSRRSR